MQIGIILIALGFPLLELAVLIKVGQTIGLWWTVLLLVVTGILGGVLVQQQGITAARRAMRSMQEGNPPIEPVADSLMLMLAGMLLLIPGLISDVLGLLLLVPPIRRTLARWMFHRVFANVDINVATHDWRSSGEGGPRSKPGSTHRAPDGGIVIDGEWERVDDPKLGSGERDGKGRGQGKSTEPRK